MNRKVELPTEIKEKMGKLISLLEQWNYEYYILNQPSVEDTVYDQHFQELQELENKHNFVFPHSPTQRPGQKISNQFRPVTRKVPMLSLDSANDYKSLLKFDERVKKILKSKEDVEYVCEWKIDGLSVSLVYRDCRLSQISTRGDGIIGEEVTFNQYLIKNIPFNLEKLPNCEVRGEIYMKKSEFQRLNKELTSNGGKPLANPRNAAAGSLRTLTPLQNRNLHFFAYQLFDSDLPTQLTCLQILENLGFLVSPDYRVCENIEKVWEFIQKQEKIRESLDFESDGVVVKVNNYALYDKLGQTSKFPRWAIAYKFPACVSTSQVKDIYVEVSRSGRITYVAVINPVILQGSTISKVTLHNYTFIQNLKLNIRDEIVIKKAGDVIPQVTQVIKLSNGSFWIPPANCPSCGSELEWNSTNIYQLCKNDECSQKVINFLNHFASKSGMDIKGINHKNIEKLYQNDLLKNPLDFYQLEPRKEELLKLEGFQEKTVHNLLTSIENSKKKPLTNLLTALGIPLLSSVKAKKITVFYPTLNSFLTALENKEWERIRDILGEKTQKEIKNYFQKPKNRELLKGFQQYL